jgi:hypothetical protein
MVSAKDVSAIASYLKKRLEYLRVCNSEVENHLLNDAEMVDSIQEGDAGQTLAKQLLRIGSIVGNTFRYSMVVALCTFLEEAVKLICETGLADYNARLQGVRKGNWLTKHRQILADLPTADLPGVQMELDTMEEFIEVRNCVAHAWGNAARCRNKKRIAEIVQRHHDSKDGRGIMGGMPYFGMSSDGFVVVEDNAAGAAIVASSEIVDGLLKGILGFSAHSVL